MSKRNEVYAAIDSERDYQDAKWGNTLSNNRPGKGGRSIDEFAAYIVGYTNKMIDVVSTFGDPIKKLSTIRKIAGLCVACMEQHGAPFRSQNTHLTKVQRDGDDYFLIFPPEALRAIGAVVGDEVVWAIDKGWSRQPSVHANPLVKQEPPWAKTARSNGPTTPLTHG